MSCDFLNDKCNMFVALHFAGKNILKDIALLDC